MRSEVASELADLDARVIAQRASERLLVGVNVAGVTRQLAARHERHLAALNRALVRLHTCQMVNTKLASSKLPRRTTLESNLSQSKNWITPFPVAKLAVISFARHVSLLVTKKKKT